MRRAALVLLLLLIAATNDALAHPAAAIAAGADGQVYFVDTGGGVFSIERNGRLVRREAWRSTARASRARCDRIFSV